MNLPEESKRNEWTNEKENYIVKQKENVKQ